MATIVVGPYTEYEKPPPILVTFTQSDGTTALDISGLDVEVVWVRNGETTEQSFAGTLSTDGTDGVASVPWGSQLVTPFDEPGTVFMEVWVGDGSTRYASERIRFKVRPAVALTEPGV
jgi:hypothetical protein